MGLWDEPAPRRSDFLIPREYQVKAMLDCSGDLLKRRLLFSSVNDIFNCNRDTALLQCSDIQERQLHLQPRQACSLIPSPSSVLRELDRARAPESKIRVWSRSLNPIDTIS